MNKKQDSPFAIGAFVVAAGLLIAMSVLLINRLPSGSVHLPVSATTYP